ncbi:MAG: HNH endonuclease [Micromonosporaceae bacterium]|nr:HNH endonuclease [Micromonosporaceae bacterium]
MGRKLPGGQYAFRIVSFGSPDVRERFPRGVLIDPDGYPEWKLAARAMVRLPAPPAGMTLDELRVVDVLAANALLERGADPLWQAPDRVPGGTPPGWTWAHLAQRHDGRPHDGQPQDGTGTRELACVPIELHAAWRHAGGFAGTASSSSERGLRIDYAPRPVPARPSRTLAEGILERVERSLGGPLPPAYRRFLAGTDGATPEQVGVLRGYGFTADQQLFGIDRADPVQHLVAANGWLADRFTDEFLAIGHLQGGMLAVKVRGTDQDSVWYWDDDDPRDQQQYDAGTVCAQLLHRCAEDIDEFWYRLGQPAQELRELAAGWATGGQVVEVRPEGIGDNLPSAYRAPWQPAPIPDREYFADPVIQLAFLHPDPA